MEDAYLIKIVDVHGEVEYYTVCETRRELWALVADLDDENYVILEVQNLGCVVSDPKEFMKYKEDGTGKSTEKNI